VIYALSKKDSEAREVLARLDRLSGERYVPPFLVALIHAGLGEIDQAFDWLDRAREHSDHWVETLKVHPVLDALRADERYPQLLDRVGLGG
jgi:hypothetical protein